jgi:hypothetical protein
MLKDPALAAHPPTPLLLLPRALLCRCRLLPGECSAWPLPVVLLCCRAEKLARSLMEKAGLEIREILALLSS